MVLYLWLLLLVVKITLGNKNIKNIGNKMTIIAVIIRQDTLVFDNLLSFVGDGPAVIFVGGPYGWSDPIGQNLKQVFHLLFRIFNYKGMF